MTLLTTSIFARDDNGWQAEALGAFTAGADAVELRLDDFDGHPDAVARFVADHPDRTWILTCRAADEGGRFDGDTVDRVARLLEASRGHNAYVDFEWAHWQRSANIRQKVLLAASANRESEREGDHKLILSAHDFHHMPADLADRVAMMQADRHADVVKIAAATGDVCDNFTMLNLLRASPKPMIALCMGEAGLMSRVLAGKFGAFATYCAADSDSNTAPGQLTLSEMRDRYRCRKINPATRVFGVIGDPVGQSMGPILHNAWFASAGIDAVYLPILVSAKPAVLTRFLDGCVANLWLDIEGLSVTLPHKITALQWVGEGADRRARTIGALNTLVRDGDRWSGHNTDADAAIDSLTEGMGITRSDLRDVPVDMLGAGGSARAVAAALDDCGARVTIYNRTPQRAVSLASDFHATARPWSKRAERTGKIVINCTKVGMTTSSSETPISAADLSGCECVFDLIYNPIETRLLREARAEGITALGGLDMFIRQAVRQFELWTGQTPDVEQGRALIEDHVRLAEGEPSVSRNAIGNETRSIALIGYRGCGKTVVGRLLAKRLGGSFVDTDELIVHRAGRSIADIFKDEGAPGFRDHESDAITEAIQRRPTVLSLGGGAVLRPEHIDRIRAAATVVYLSAPPEVLFRRISKDAKTADNRPSLTDADGIEEVRRLLPKRDPLYRRAAHRIIDVSSLTPPEVVERIINELKNIEQEP